MDDNNNINNTDNRDNTEENKLPEIETTQAMIDAEYFAEDEEEREPRFAEKIFDLIEIVTGAFLIVILIFTFALKLVTVHGPSMMETLHDQDKLVITQMFNNPKQGDIIVIQVPNPQYETPIIKRVIATEGQTIEFDFDNWIVKVDGMMLDEPYVNYEMGRAMKSESISRENPVVVVEPGKIFVMGDNRNNSSDSRDSSIGQIDVRNVVGRVLFRIFPFDKFGFV